MARVESPSSMLNGERRPAKDDGLEVKGRGWRARSEGMKKRIREDGLGPLSTGGDDTQSWLALPSGLGFAVAILAAALAGAEEPERVAQAGVPESRAAASDPAAEPDSAAEANPAASDPAVEPDPAAPDSAAERESSFRPGIEEIVVLGAESEGTRDFATADSVTGFGAEDLAALGAQDIADLAAFTPNLEIVTYGATSPTFFIRGVGLNDFNPNSTGAVAIYQDDVARNAPALQLSTLFDIEAVNVLRGPQGTGPARNASAGAIKIYSRKPTGEFDAYLRSELGNFDFRDYEGAIEAPIVEDILAGRFAFRFSERDGTMKNRCADAEPFEERVPSPTLPDLEALQKLNSDPPLVAVWRGGGAEGNIRSSGGPRVPRERHRQLGRARNPALPAHPGHELAAERTRLSPRRADPPGPVLRNGWFHL